MLLVLGSVFVGLLAYIHFSGFTKSDSSSLFILIAILIIPLALAYLASKYAPKINRSGDLWGLLCLFLPFIIPFILALMKERLILNDNRDSFMVGLRTMLFVAVVGALPLIYFGFNEENTENLVFVFLLYFATIFLAYLYADRIRGSGMPWAIASIFIPFLTPFLLVIIPVEGGLIDSILGRKSQIDGSQMWKCPECSAVLVKKQSDDELYGLLGAKNIVGTVTCGNCNAQFARQAVYSGRYDV